MLVVLSPAKTINQSKITGNTDCSIPEFLKESEILVKILRKLEPLDISSLMGISAKLADLNSERFLKWDKEHNPQNSKQAAFAFDGDVYDGLDVGSLPTENLEFLAKNLRILSGLYGVLKPMDLMQAYRLEMGTKLENTKGGNLYKYWGNKITKNLNQAIEQSDGEKVLINLASNEYFKAIDHKTLKYPIITPVFKEYKDDSYQIISFFAKKARGLMTRYISLEKINSPEQIKFFNLDRYAYNEGLSTEKHWVFTR